MELIRQHIYTRGTDGFDTVAASDSLSRNTITKLEKLEGCAATAEDSEVFLWTSLDDDYLLCHSVWQTYGNGINDTRPHPFIHTYLIPKSIACRWIEDPHTLFCQTSFETKYNPDFQPVERHDCPRLHSNMAYRSKRQWPLSFLCIFANRLLLGKPSVINLEGESKIVNADALDLITRAYKAIPRFLCPDISFLTALSKKTIWPSETGFLKPMVYFAHNIPKYVLFDLACRHYEAEVLDPEKVVETNVNPLASIIATAMYNDTILTNQDIQLIKSAHEDKLDFSATGFLVKLVHVLRNQGDSTCLNELIEILDIQVDFNRIKNYLEIEECRTFEKLLDVRRYNKWSSQEMHAPKTADSLINRLKKSIDWGADLLAEEKVADILNYRGETAMLRYRQLVLAELSNGQVSDVLNSIIQDSFTIDRNNLRKESSYALELYEKVISLGVDTNNNVDKVSLFCYIDYMCLANISQKYYQSLSCIFLSMTEDEKIQIIKKLQIPNTTIIQNLFRQDISEAKDRNKQLPLWLSEIPFEDLHIWVVRDIIACRDLPRALMYKSEFRKTIINNVNREDLRSDMYKTILLFISDEPDNNQSQYLLEVLRDLKVPSNQCAEKDIMLIKSWGQKIFGDNWATLWECTTKPKKSRKLSNQPIFNETQRYNSSINVKPINDISMHVGQNPHIQQQAMTSQYMSCQTQRCIKQKPTQEMLDDEWYKTRQQLDDFNQKYVINKNGKALSLDIHSLLLDIRTQKRIESGKHSVFFLAAAFPCLLEDIGINTDEIYTICIKYIKKRGKNRNKQKGELNPVKRVKRYFGGKIVAKKKDKTVKNHDDPERIKLRLVTGIIGFLMALTFLSIVIFIFYYVLN